MAQISRSAMSLSRRARRGPGHEMPVSDVDRAASHSTARQRWNRARTASARRAGLMRACASAPARRLEGMTRHASVHAAGVVITPRPLTEFVPLYKSQKDEITTQWAMKEIERVGLLKMDFLGLSTLTLLDDAVKHIRETTGQESTSIACRRTIPGRTSSSRTDRRTGCSSSRVRACATCCAAPNPSASRTSSR
jgi:DNA polymerase-3 subunit alpha